MKPGFMHIVGIFLLCFSSGSAFGGELSKQCPDPNIKYETWSGERYWEEFVDSHLSEAIRTKDFICAKNAVQYTDSLRFFDIVVAVKGIENREAKQRGLLVGIGNIFGAFDTAAKHYKKDKSIWVQVVEKFSSDYVPMMEQLTNVKFEDPEDWFDWWETNKDRLVLSKNGKYLVVKK